MANAVQTRGLMHHEQDAPDTCRRGVDGVQKLPDAISYRRVELMSESSKCPMGDHPWLATFLAVAFILVFLSKKLGLL